MLWTGSGPSLADSVDARRPAVVSVDPIRCGRDWHTCVSMVYFRPNCAWQVATEPSSSSFGYLDLNAYYHTLVIWEFEDDDVYRFTGRFPLMR